MHRIGLLMLVPLVLLFTLPVSAQVADTYMTPSVGALNLAATQHALAAAEDRFLPLKLGTERTRLGLAAGILYRAAKFTAIDVPQDHMLLVVQHEFFGH